jgi:hypothetical protein
VQPEPKSNPFKAPFFTVFAVVGLGVLIVGAAAGSIFTIVLGLILLLPAIFALRAIRMGAAIRGGCGRRSTAG